MALSKELKAFINKNYNDRIQAIESEKKKAVDEAKRAFKQEKQSFAKVTLVKAQNALDKAWSILEAEGFFPDYSLKEALRGIESCVNAPSFNGAAELVEPFQARINKLNAEREKLLIMLSMEKDFERISAKLKEYGIQL